MSGFTYRDLVVWQRAMALVETVYQVTAAFPKAELFGLTGQARRAAISIAANLAEGHTRHTTRSFAFHVSVARGSLAVLETCLEVAERIGMLSRDVHQQVTSVVASVGQLITNLHQALQRKMRSGSTATSNESPNHGP
jgi:four helix bundle protein